MAEQTENTEVIETGTEAETGNESTTSTETTVREFSDVEKQALAQGWVPEDQYHGTAKWRDAEAFLDRGELFGKIDEQKRRLERQDMTIQELKKHYESVRKTEFKRALDALRAEKRNAFVEGDVDKVMELDDKIAETKQEQLHMEQVAQAQPVQQEVAPHPAYVAFVNRNPWYNTDRAMKLFADEVGQKLGFAGETSPVKILEEVERQVKKEFAHKFTNPNRVKPGAVDSAGGKGTSTRTTIQLTDDERRVMKRFVSAGVMTEAEYIRDIKEARGE